MSIVKNTNLVLQSSEVDAGLTSNGGVNHREKCGGDVDIVDASFKGGSGKTTQVGHHASTEVYHQRMAGGSHAL